MIRNAHGVEWVVVMDLRLWLHKYKRVGGVRSLHPKHGAVGALFNSSVVVSLLSHTMLQSNHGL